MTTPATDREYELERKLWDTLADVEALLASFDMQDDPGMETVWPRLRERVQHWREHQDWYLQHPKWEETQDTTR